MRIDKIDRLLQALGGSASNSRSGKSIERGQKAADAQGSEAVVVADSFGSSSTEAGGSSSSKVEKIKEAVRSGTYNVSSEDIAQALAKELFA